MFEPNDKKLAQRYKACKSGKLTCGECKRELANRVYRFLREHQTKRKKAEKLVKYLLK